MAFEVDLSDADGFYDVNEQTSEPVSVTEFSSRVIKK